MSAAVTPTLIEKKVLDSSGYESDIENTPRRDDVVITGPPRHRRRRDRTQFSAVDLTKLEEYFLTDRYPDIHARERLAEELAVSEDRIQVWFQNRRSKSRRRTANRPPPLSLPKHIIATHVQPVAKVPPTPVVSSARGSFPSTSDWGFALLSNVAVSSLPSPIPPIGNLIFNTRPNVSPTTVRDLKDEKDHVSKPVAFKRPWETPSMSEQRSKRFKTSDSALTTTQVSEMPMATPDVLCHATGIAPIPSPGYLPLLPPFIPYSTLGHPANGYMFFNPNGHSVLGSYT